MRTLRTATRTALGETLAMMKLRVKDFTEEVAALEEKLKETRERKAEMEKRIHEIELDLSGEG